MKVLEAIPERRKHPQNGQILEVEEMCKCVISRVGNYSRSIGNIWSAEELVIYRRWSGVGFWQFVRRTLLRTSRVALVLFTLKVSHLNFQPCVWMTALCASLPVATDHPDHAAIDVQVG